jgi:hypothetical protein
MTEPIDSTPIAIPCERGPIVHEYADGDIAVRVNIDAADAPLFFKAFPEAKEPVFFSNGDGAIEATRGPIISERKDGGLALKIIVAAAHKERFRELWPTPGLLAVLAREDPVTGKRRMIDTAAGAAEEPAAYGRFARVLRTHVSFMLARKVWEAVGTDDEYLEWCKHQKCAKCGWTPHWEMSTFMLCDPAHVRRIADGAGVALKPAYSAIPLCHDHHVEQHRVGEAILGGKEAVDRARIKHVQDWVWDTLKATLGFEHWSEVPPATLVTWAREHDLVDTLPDVYLEAAAS